MQAPYPLLTIGGSDSGGAAGIQADLKTWAALGVYGMSAITAVTAQNSARVAAIQFLPPDMVAAQIDAVMSDYGAVVIKTGFIGRVDLIEIIAAHLDHWRQTEEPRPLLIVDPVLVNHRREAMFPPDVAAAYHQLLFPLADLITPNWAEAELLGLPASSAELMLEQFARLGAARVLVTGQSLDDETILDLYWDGRGLSFLPQPRLATANLHGSGDTLSAAIAAGLAGGYEWPEAIRRAQQFTHRAILLAAGWRLGAGHGPLAQGLAGQA